jgi:hypothetical protein
LVGRNAYGRAPVVRRDALQAVTSIAMRVVVLAANRPGPMVVCLSAAQFASRSAPYCQAG